MAATATSQAAKLRPPSVYLTGQENIAIVAEARERIEDDRILFRRLESLHGDSTEEIEVRMGKQGPADVELGGTYILGYTLLQRLPQFYAPDPQGARVVAVPAVGPALLENTPELRSLLKARGRPREPGGRDVLEVILSQVQRSDLTSRRFVLAELVLRPDLLDSLTDPDLAILRTTLESGQLDPLSHDYLLRALRPLGRSDVLPWLARACRAVLHTYPTDLDLASYVPSLVKLAAQMLGEQGAASDVPLLNKHLYSNNPGVGKAALKAMTILDENQTRIVARKALEKGDLQPDVDRALRRLLEPPATPEDLPTNVE